MIVSADNEAQSAEILRKRGIARKILAHSVGQLHDTAHLYSFGNKNIIGDIGNTIGTFVNILRTLDIHMQHPIMDCTSSLLILYHKSTYCAPVFDKVHSSFKNTLSKTADFKMPFPTANYAGLRYCKQRSMCYNKINHGQSVLPNPKERRIYPCRILLLPLPRPCPTSRRMS